MMPLRPAPWKHSFRLLFCAVIGAASLLLSGCHHHDVSPPTVFTLTVNPNYDSTTTEHWLLIHNTDGELVDYRQFHNGDVINFLAHKNTANGKLSITQMSVNGEKISLRTYLDIAVGKNMILNPTPRPTASPVESTGDFYVTINNCPDLANRTMVPYVNLDESSEGTVKFMGPSVSVPTGFLVILQDFDGHFKYIKIDTVDSGGNYVFDYTDLVDFDQIRTIRFDGANSVWYSITTTGTAPLWDHANYTITPFSPYDSRPVPYESVQLNYLSLLPDNQTYVRINYERGSYYYVKKGDPPPDNFTIPTDFTLEVVSDSLQNFSFSHPLNYISRSSYWGKPNMTWQVYGTSDSQTFKELPSEFASLYPTLTLHGWTYQSTTAYTLSLPWDVLVDYRFAGNTDDLSKEYASGYFPHLLPH